MTTALPTAPPAYGPDRPSAVATVDNATPQGSTYHRGNSVQTNGAGSMNRSWRHNAIGLEDEKPREAQNSEGSLNFFEDLIMHILITGASGFIGAYVVREATRRLHQVTVVSRNPERDDSIRFPDVGRLVWNLSDERGSRYLRVQC